LFGHVLISFYLRKGTGFKVQDIRFGRRKKAQNQRSEVKKTEIGDRRSEVRDQKSEVGGQKPEKKAQGRWVATR
jgi:hypothetical protein